MSMYNDATSNYLQREAHMRGKEGSTLFPRFKRGCFKNFSVYFCILLGDREYLDDITHVLPRVNFGSFTREGMRETSMVS